jgi:hypothetical protein
MAVPQGFVGGITSEGKFFLDQSKQIVWNPGISAIKIGNALIEMEYRLIAIVRPMRPLAIAVAHRR